DGLVIRELNVGESDRIITILTREKGVVRASAKGARIPKNRFASVCRLLCFSRFTLFAGREKYIIDEAEPLDVFIGLRGSLSGLALGQYFCELCGAVAPQEEPAEPFLRLILNALHLLETGSRPPTLVKAAFELRLLTLAGYMPDLVACRGCGAYEQDTMYLLPVTGCLMCADCLREKSVREAAMPLSKGALAAMRHAVYSDFERLFSFSLPEPALEQLSEAAEASLVSQLERSFATLEFYRNVRDV
ncbi:MAG: DNA repair protein RecO, partial [Clostridia bacterium]|nr:DNA repair protein RecO [Clostridia bacterium]